MGDLADAFRLYLNAFNLRDWAVLQGVVAPSLFLNGSQLTASDFVAARRAETMSAPDLRLVAEHVVVEGERLGALVWEWRMGATQAQIGLYRWDGTHIAEITTVGGTA